MTMHPNKKQWIRPVIAFFGVALIMTFFYTLFAQHSVAQKRERALAVISGQTHAITNRFNVIFARDYTLSNLVSANAGITDFFDTIAPALFNETAEFGGISLKNIALAPSGIVEKVYPLEGNEGLIGFNFMDANKAGNTEAIEAYQRGQLVVTNPFTLVQGGTGIGGRLPVFLGSGSDKKLWGLVTITLDCDTFLSALNLDALENNGYAYRLWYCSSTGETITLKASSKEVKSPVTQSFSLSNLTWNLDVSPTNGWYNPIEGIAAFIVILSFSLMVAALQMDKINIKAANAKLERLAQTDALTTCYSRQYVNAILVNQVNGRWNDPTAKYSLAMLDIDYFKNVNDTYGHEIGDRVIVAVAKILMANCKLEIGDCVIRYGGDEFVILFNDVTFQRFEKKLQTIIKQIRAIHFSDVPELHVTVSIGGEYYTSPLQSLYYDLIHRADEKLYCAKEAGRDRYQL